MQTGYYGRLLGALVSSWRTAFDVNFTALIIQIAPFALVDPTPQDRTANGQPALRGQQADAVSLLSSAALTITLECVGWLPPLLWEIL